MPVKNYSPELLKVFEAGSKKPFEFDCKTPSKAKALRWRLHHLRREMRKEHHWLTPVAEGVILTIRDSFLIASPPDMEIEEELKKALEENRIAGEKYITDVPPDSNIIKSLTQPSGVELYLQKGEKK